MTRCVFFLASRVAHVVVAAAASKLVLGWENESVVSNDLIAAILCFGVLANEAHSVSAALPGLAKSLKCIIATGKNI